MPETDLRFIGFLDIFGFENFGYNTFEQLCINFTNERLQSHFTDALIKRQVEDYKKEGLDVSDIKFPDNMLQIKLIDANKGSVLSMLDEECVVPKGSDVSYVSKMIKAFAKPHKCVLSGPAHSAAAARALGKTRGLRAAGVVKSSSSRGLARTATRSMASK